MAKFNGLVVVIEETNLEALYYYKYLIEYENREIKAPPIMFYDSIDKKGIDQQFQDIKQDLPLDIMLDTNNGFITQATSTCWHGFVYNTIHENIRDEGLANKHMREIAKKIKEHTAPYNNIFKKYSVHVYNG